LIRVLVWSKSAIMRTGLETLARADNRFEVVSVGPGTADLQRMVREFSPDVVLFDGNDEKTASSLPKFIGNANAPTSLVLVDQIRRTGILRMLQSGARGLVLRGAHAEEITEALAAVHQGLVVLSPEILEALAPTGGELPADEESPPGEPLTPREIEVLGLLADGASNREIAHRMQISEHTAKFHVSSILNKLGATTRTEAVTRGYKEGLILI
jgi:two-component system, NarL family, response regulator YdfI